MVRQSTTFHSGSRVRVQNIPDWLLRDLPADDQSRLRDQQGCVVEVLEVLPNGYLWLSFADGTAGFSVQVSDVVPVTGSST